jgi:hypothetical protein
MATSGWETFGSVLGGGIDRVGAFEQGRLRTAQTESALGMARKRQLENVSLEAKNRAQEQFRESLAKSGMLPPEQVDLAANTVLGELGSDFNSTMSGLETGQEMNFRDTLADPAAGPGMRFLAGQGVQGKVLSPYEIQGNMVSDLRRPDQEPVANDLGEAMIDTQQATAELRRVQAGDPDYTTVSGSGGAGGLGKEPPKYKVNPNFDPSRPAGPDNPEVVPVVGGSADPNVGPAMGVRERAVVGRIFNAARNTAADLGNIVEMPSGASLGRLGIGLGATPGSTVMDAVAGSMKLALSPQEVRRYNQSIGNLSVQIRTLEQMGMQGTQGMAEQFDTLQFRPEDTVADKMYKLAIIRQSLENAVGTILSLNQNMPDEAKSWAQETITNAQRSVPYTPRDVIALEAAQAQNPNVTLRQLIQEKRGAAPEPAGPARTLGGQEVLPPNPKGQELPLVNDKGWQLLEDAQGNLAYVSPDGREIEEVQ